MLPYSSIYLAKGKPAIVVAAQFNTAGIGFEQDDPIVVADWEHGESLAIAVRESLRRFCFRERSLRDWKKTDWPGFIASGFRSVADFERTYRRIEVRAFNTAQVSWDAHTIPAGESQIALHVTLNLGPGLDHQTVQQLVRLFQAASVWYEQMKDHIGQ
jgi:hypothetical protein